MVEGYVEDSYRQSVEDSVERTTGQLGRQPRQLSARWVKIFQYSAIKHDSYGVGTHFY